MIADAQRALIWTMVIVSAADGRMTDSELRTIGENVRLLQAFQGLDPAQLPVIAEECTGMLATADGLEQIIGEIRAALPDHLRETAYALACDTALADTKPSREEVRLLEHIRDGLEIDPLIAAAIERGTRARHATV